MSDVQPDDRFVSFVDPVYGIRAMVKILISYNARGINTTKGIISAWAPAHENPLNSYIGFVSSYTFAAEDEILEVDNPNDIIPLLEAIVKFENGQQPYDYETFESAYYLALGKEKPCLKNLKQSLPNSSQRSLMKLSLMGRFRLWLERLFG